MPAQMLLTGKTWPSLFLFFPLQSFIKDEKSSAVTLYFFSFTHYFLEDISRPLSKKPHTSFCLHKDVAMCVTTEGRYIILFSKDGPLATPRNCMPCVCTGSHAFALEK